MLLSEIISALEDTRRAHLLHSGATEAQLNDCETTMGVKIPSEYRAFLQCSNGAVLYETEELLGTVKPWEMAETIQEVTVRLRKDHLIQLPSSLIPFHRTGNRGYLCFDTSKVAPDGTTPIVEWVQGVGLGGERFSAFQDWYAVRLYQELHSRYKA